MRRLHSFISAQRQKTIHSKEWDRSRRRRLSFEPLEDRSLLTGFSAASWQTNGSAQLAGERLRLTNGINQAGGSWSKTLFQGAVLLAESDFHII